MERTFIGVLGVPWREYRLEYWIMYCPIGMKYDENGEQQRITEDADLNTSRSTAGSTEHDCRDLWLCVRSMVALVHRQPAGELRGSMGGSARRRPFLAHKSINTNIVASVLPLLASLI